MRFKRGQVTIFIIIAIFIVALGTLAYFFYPQIKSTLRAEEKTPQGFIRFCIEDKIKDTVNILSLQGGSVEPEFYFPYNNVSIEYLCYTNENYKTCVVQQPLLKTHIEKEIKENIEDEVNYCFTSLKENYQKRGYDVQLEEGETKVELLPQRIVTTFNKKLTLSKGETERYEKFEVVLNNNLYELIAIANSIIEWEATQGDADVRIYMAYYPNLKVEKNLRDDGTRIYIITDRNTGDKFQFASRSLVYGPEH